MVKVVVITHQVVTQRFQLVFTSQLKIKGQKVLQRARNWILAVNGSHKASVIKFIGGAYAI